MFEVGQPFIGNINIINIANFYSHSHIENVQAVNLPTKLDFVLCL